MNPLTAALRAQIDQRVADYIDAAIADAVDQIDLRHVDLDESIRMIVKDTLNLDNRLANLEASTSAATKDDKYSLTKAKLVRLMKDMGYL